MLFSYNKHIWYISTSFPRPSSPPKYNSVEHDVSFSNNITSILITISTTTMNTININTTWNVSNRGSFVCITCALKIPKSATFIHINTSIINEKVNSTIIKWKYNILFPFHTVDVFLLIYLYLITKAWKKERKVMTSRTLLKPVLNGNQYLQIWQNQRKKERWRKRILPLFKSCT